MEVMLSKHAEKRLRERLNIGKKACIRIAQKAHDEGITMDGENGSLNKWLAYTARKGHDSDRFSKVKIYGEYAYIFNGNMLITVYELPNRIKNKALYKQKKK